MHTNNGILRRSVKDVSTVQRSEATIGQCADVNNGYKRPSRYSCKKDFERKLKAQQATNNAAHFIVMMPSTLLDRNKDPTLARAYQEKTVPVTPSIQKGNIVDSSSTPGRFAHVDRFEEVKRIAGFFTTNQIEEMNNALIDINTRSK